MSQIIDIGIWKNIQVRNKTSRKSHRKLRYIEKLIDINTEKLRNMERSKIWRTAFMHRYESARQMIEKYPINFALKYEFYIEGSRFACSIFEHNLAKETAYQCVRIGKKKMMKAWTLEGILQLIRVYTFTYDFKKIINLWSAVPRFINRDTELDILKRIYFNVAMAYSSLEQYDKSLYLLNVLTSKFKLSHGQKLDIEMMKGNCLLSQPFIWLAEEKYKNALRIAQKLEDVDNIVLACSNLSNLYLQYGLLFMAKKYIVMALSTKNPTNARNLNLAYKIALDLAIRENHYHLVEFYGDKAIKKALEYNDIISEQGIKEKITSFYNGLENRNI